MHERQLSVTPAPAEFNISLFSRNGVIKLLLRAIKPAGPGCLSRCKVHGTSRNRVSSSLLPSSFFLLLLPPLPPLLLSSLRLSLAREDFSKKKLVGFQGISDRDKRDSLYNGLGIVKPPAVRLSREDIKRFHWFPRHNEVGIRR